MGFALGKRLCFAASAPVPKIPALPGHGGQYKEQRPEQRADSSPAPSAARAEPACPLERAAAVMPAEIDPQIATAITYPEWEHDDQAYRALTKARRLCPDDPRLGELATLIESEEPASA